MQFTEKTNLPSFQGIVNFSPHLMGHTCLCADKELLQALGGLGHSLEPPSHFTLHPYLSCFSALAK